MANTIDKFEGWLKKNKPITEEQYKEFIDYKKTITSKREKLRYWQVGEGLQLLRLAE